MRMRMTCMLCFPPDGQPDYALYAAELKNDGTFELDCRNGHHSRVILQQQRFEYLLELGANAIVDGYYREAISSFAAGLERFFEFYVRAIFAARKVGDAIVEATWKHVGKQSERQLGAYVAIYTLENGTSPEILPQKFVELRNEVIHKGKVASRDEAIEFGDAVIKIIAPPLEKLRSQHPDVIEALTGKHVWRIGSALPQGTVVPTMSVPTIVSVTRTMGEPQPDVRSWLAKLEKSLLRSI